MLAHTRIRPEPEVRRGHRPVGFVPLGDARDELVAGGSNELGDPLEGWFGAAPLHAGDRGLRCAGSVGELPLGQPSPPPRLAYQPSSNHLREV